MVIATGLKTQSSSAQFDGCSGKMWELSVKLSARKVAEDGDQMRIRPVILQQCLSWIDLACEASELGTRRIDGRVLL